MKKQIYLFALLTAISHFTCQPKNDDDTPNPMPDPEWQLTTTLNPAGVNPLCAKLDISANVSGKVKIEVIGQDGDASNIVHTFDDITKEHSIPILGLYADYENIVKVSYLNESNEELLRDTLKITTSAIPDLLTQIDIDTQKPDKMEAGLTLVSYRGISNPHIPFMIDAFGKIRWILDYSNHPILNELHYDVGIERLQNGHFYFGEKRTNTIYEVDVYGEVVNSWSLAPYEFHHNVQEKPNGNFLVTASSNNSIHLNGKTTIEDQIIEIDRQGGGIVNVWDLKESLDENRTVWDVNLNASVIDWAHGNAVIFDESDNTIIVSCQKQGVVKLDEDNNVVWILAPYREWGVNRKGDDLNNYLLTPLDANSNPITDADVLNGYANHTDFEWSWYQHAPKLMPNGNIVLFDNGYLRNYTDAEKYSRAVEYEINKNEKTVRQVWQYGKERGTETYSSVVSDVDYLPHTNNILFSPGYKTENGNGLGGKIVEVDYLTKEVVFEARLSGYSSFQFHRAERLSLYPN